MLPAESKNKRDHCSSSHSGLLHNHPSGDPTPSKADIEMTRQVRDAAEKLGVVLHDHVIVARNRHASFRTMGLL